MNFFDLLDILEYDLNSMKDLFVYVIVLFLILFVGGFFFVLCLCGAVFFLLVLLLLFGVIMLWNCCIGVCLVWLISWYSVFISGCIKFW